MDKKSFIERQVELIELSEDEIKLAQASLATGAVKTKQQEFIKFANLNKQEDLLYFKAVYASCGFNLNDDVFLIDEFWKARSSPIWKPINWQHNQEDIIGCIYAVQAKKMDGTFINVDDDDVPSEPFELVVYGVIYKYIFPKYAKEIKERSNASKLFVSMESWFDDYAFALMDKTTGSTMIVERNQETAALTNRLRICGGTGDYEGKRLGRVLKGITFAGMGIVFTPANPSSVGLVSATKLETPMSDKKIDITELEAIKPLVEASQKLPTIEKNLATAEENIARLTKQLEEDRMAKSIADTVMKALDGFDLVEAGLTSTTPPEIARIDAASDKFAAKLAFLKQTGKAFADERTHAKTEHDKVVAELETLKKELEAAKKTAATWKEVSEGHSAEVAELRALKEKAAAEKLANEKLTQDNARIADLKGINFPDELIEKLKATSNFLELDKDAYNKWLEEKKVVAATLPLRKNGGQGSPSEEGASGLQKAKQEPRFKITAEILRNAKIEKKADLTEPVQPAKSNAELFTRAFTNKSPDKK